MQKTSSSMKILLLSSALLMAYPGSVFAIDTSQDGDHASMHRFSGMGNPEAPITHHWLDSTHVT